ncbi:hypothetical protein O7635_27645 [Asanoa sp. WMMD1127]|uniref:hypothetical protein n=1 Tax=Asanoa sp. WMMD1127 TaxID=3016107 RepID=UPI0024168A71|nr:hypothetical protein [Asanoa sp. WMMD1127]MDG4825638.1 hypothetical protein [Asanoa sp. WMMD1127]
MAKHISSEAIDAVATYLRDQVADGDNGVAGAKAQLPATEVGFPGFGIVGIPLAVSYGDLCQRVETTLDEMGRTVDDYVTELGRARDAWVAAENANTVVVKG